jgi:hypothetical protein
MRQIESATGLCSACGAHRRLTGSLDVERHTRKVKGGMRRRCAGTGRKPSGARRG